VLPISYTYTSLYATPDSETHFRTVQVQLDPVENFALPSQPVCIGGSLTGQQQSIFSRLSAEVGRIRSQTWDLASDTCPSIRDSPPGPYRHLRQ
jgi:hypothetical protein